MAGPTVNIKILADASQAAGTMDKASGKVSKFGKSFAAAAVPIAAAGAALFGMGKSAVEDAAGQARLAKSLQNATGATDEQISSLEEWITKMSMASGVADDEMRPALATMARATGSVRKAQAGLVTALNVSAATGKPLADVANAMAKGYGGNTNALGKLVPGLNKTVLATKDMNVVTAELNRLTGGQSRAAANTAEGQFKRLTLALDETKESIGGALLPAISQVVPWLLKLATFLQKNADVVGPLVVILGGLAAVIWAVNAAMAANPVTLVVLGVGALIAILVVAYKKSETFRLIVQAAWRGIAAAAQWAWSNVLRPALTFIMNLAISLWITFRKVASGIATAIGVIATAALWLWRNVIGPAIRGIASLFGVLWTAAMSVRDKVVGAFRTLWTTASNMKDKVIGAVQALADMIAKPFDTISNAISSVIGWFGRLFDKITSFKIPKWLTSVLDKAGSILGLNSTATTAPTLRYLGAGRGSPTGRTAAPTPQSAASGTAGTLAGLTGAGTQVIVQVSDRRMVDLVNVQLRDARAAAVRQLTRRQVVIV